MRIKRIYAVEDVAAFDENVAAARRVRMEELGQLGQLNLSPEAIEAELRRAADRVPKPPVSCVQIIHANGNPRQTFGRKLVAQASAEGWMRRDGDRLILRATEEDLVYQIVSEANDVYVCRLGDEQHARYRRA